MSCSCSYDIAPPPKKKYKYKSPRQKEHKLIKEHNISKRERGYVTQGELIRT